MIRRFNRYELKYVIPTVKYRQLIEEFDGHAVYDAHSGANGYPLVSLYYDSPRLDCFWAKIDGIKFRRKLRLRIYPARNIEETTRGMVEIKQRMNRTVQKRRLELPLAEAEALCAGTIDPERLGSFDDLDGAVASEVLYLVNAMSLRPTAITAYHRVAFMGGPHESDLRITFDTNLRGRTHGLRVHQDAENFPLMTQDWCVMEVKADERVPDWVTSLLARHDCQMQRVSKYCAAIARLTGTSSTILAALPTAHGALPITHGGFGPIEGARAIELDRPPKRLRTPTPIPRATLPSSP